MYLAAVNNAANAVAELTGGPLAERRLLHEFPARAQAAERPGFAGGLFTLLGAERINASVLESWLEPWKTEFLAAHSARSMAHPRGPAELPREGHSGAASRRTPLAGLWPLIHTWTLAANVSSNRLGGLAGGCPAAGLLGDGLHEKVSGLDKYLDEIEARLDEVAAGQLETSTSY
jgi:hypothetical protein